MSFPLHPAISLVVNHCACSSKGEGGEAVSGFSGVVPGNRLLHDCARLSIERREGVRGGRKGRFVDNEFVEVKRVIGGVLCVVMRSTRLLTPLCKQLSTASSIALWLTCRN